MNKSKQSQTSAIAIVEDDKEMSLSKSGKSLQQMVDVETEKRAILTSYITKHMVDGTDYGKIHIVKSCPDKYNCKNAYHFSKASLFKPGAEKFSSLMQLKAEYKKDSETWEMLGSKPGTVCFICYLIDNKGNHVGEGRGAASVEEKGSPNIAIKLAEKRAKVDAVLSTGGLSDFFTQDLEDMNIDAMGQDVAPRQVAPKTAPAIRPDTMSTPQQRKLIMSLIEVKGQSVDSLKDYFLSKFKIDTSKKLTYDQALQTISALKELPDLQPIDNGPEINVDEIADGIEAEKLNAAKAAEGKSV